MPDEVSPEPKKRRRFRLDPAEHASRLTAVLAVLAAVASGQYALQVSQTTLAQAEATNEWGYYQAKSIKRNVALSEAATIRAMAVVNPQAADRLEAEAKRADQEAARYASELDGIKAKAEEVESKKHVHNQRGDRFNFAFIALQAGVILATVGSNAHRRSLLLLALVFGLAGAAVAASAMLLGH